MKTNLIIKRALLTLLTMFLSFTSSAALIYLNDSNISVSVGAGTSAGSFNNTFDGFSTIDKVIDAASADAIDNHNQTSHIWFTADSVGGGLELIFDFGQEYDITTLHFWNYFTESFDVDNIDFTFFDNSNALVGNLSILPDIGAGSGILAQDIALPAPLNVQYVTAFLTGSNKNVDFQNLGFTAQLSSQNPNNPTIPEPSTLAIFALGMIGLASRRFKKQS